MSYTKRILKFASECQMDADMSARMYLDLHRQWKVAVLFQECCEFDTKGLAYLGWYKEAIDFILKNQRDLNRKFTFDEFLDFVYKFRVKSMFKKLNTFEDFKNFNVRYSKSKKLV